MLFSTITFLFYFGPAFFLLYFAARRMAWRNVLLLIGSLVFYTWGEARFLPIMVATIVLTWFFGARVAASAGTARKRWLAAGVAIDLLMLAVFKYADFFVENLNVALGWFGVAPLPLPGLPLPLGISFFIFHAISYLIDVHRGDARPARSLLEVALYITMFPQLVAGPIIRYRSVEFHIRRRQSTWARSAFGVKLFVIGLAQKVLIADQVAAMADAAFAAAGAGPVSMLAAWGGVLAYTVQIYFDFGGYSNMAIGLGLILGFGFLRNFRFPYTARSVSEFWRRWHISLSSWFRDYLYIPLGGNRGGAWKTGRNLLVVFLLCGFWHGASWNFVIWGLHHGLFLVLERTVFGGWLARQARIVRTGYTLLAVMTGWVWFRAETVPEALAMFASMVGAGPSETVLPFLYHASPLALAALAAGAVFAFNGGAALLRRTPLAPPKLAITARMPLSTQAFLVGTLVVAAGFVASGAFSPFLYFRF
jgi:D-alanyl-lipoteichoic acid acyltransferase DltB (MBOAT superfamily)